MREEWDDVLPLRRSQGMGVRVAPLRFSSSSRSGVEVPFRRPWFVVEAEGMVGRGKADEGLETETMRSRARR